MLCLASLQPKPAFTRHILLTVLAALLLLRSIYLSARGAPSCAGERAAAKLIQPAHPPRAALSCRSPWYRAGGLRAPHKSLPNPLVFLAQPDSLMVTKKFADERGLKVNSRLPMRTMQGDREFTVRGIMKPGGLASAFGGDLAIMDIYAAQKMFGRGRKFDRIDIALQEGTSLDVATAKLQALLGSGFQVEPPSSRGEQFESTSRMYALASNITSVFALFIGMFIIYNTFAIAVTERRAEIGILRALGAMRGQIRTLFLVESALAGLAGTFVGVLFGIVMARAMSGYIGGMLTEIYGVAQSPGDLTLDPWLIGTAVAMGLVTSLVAAVIPARSAARVDPVKALQKGGFQSLGEGENRARRRWAIVFGVLSIVAFAFNRFAIVTYVGFVLAILAAVLLSPALSFWLSRALRPLLARLRPVEGALAADSLIQAPRRTSGTIAALMLSLALVISLGGLARSSYDSLADWMRIALNPDFFVTTAETLSSRSFVFPASLADGLRAIQGVAEVQPVRTRAYDGEKCSDHGDRDRCGRGRKARASASGRRKLGRNVPAGGRGERRGGFGEFRAAA